MKKEVVLITGAAGFIGYHLSSHLLREGELIVGIDNLNDYYDVNLKLTRLKLLESQPNFYFERMDLCDKPKIESLFKKYNIKKVIHLAAQAGVRYSIENPDIYVQSNVVGFLNILECCRHYHIDHLIFASTSSVYGGNIKQPFSENDTTDHPMTLYAATKKSNELMAHAYASLYQLPVTGLRFFTVYGPWGRPDMALFKFTKNILENKPITVFNHGKMTRDFTYVDDVVKGIACALRAPAQSNHDWKQKPECATSYAPYQIFNIGNSNPESLMHYIEAIETTLGKKAQYDFLPMQQGDVPSTHADTTRLFSAFGYKPSVSIQEGVKAFVTWYLQFYHKEINANV